MTAAALPDDGPLPDEVDVVVVGAGPSGSATAHHLARRGRRVLLLEKTGFPREKVCGDGLTPRAGAALAGLGVDTDATAGWAQSGRSACCSTSTGSMIPVRTRRGRASCSSAALAKGNATCGAAAGASLSVRPT